MALVAQSPQQVERVQCSFCKQMVDKNDCVSKRGAAEGSANQRAHHMCKPCHNTKKRIGRLQEFQGTDIDKVVRLGPEDRAAMVEEARNLTGAALATVVNDRIEKSEQRKNTRQFKTR